MAIREKERERERMCEGYSSVRPVHEGEQCR